MTDAAARIAEMKTHMSLPLIGAPMFLASGVDLVVAQQAEQRTPAHHLGCARAGPVRYR